MSAQKLVAEADRLLERGKYPEAIEKLNSAISADPLNQLIATKLANAYMESEDPVNAKKVLVGAAHRLSEAGKSQVAIAIYKQAIELAPDDIELRSKYATECEGVGKIGDAVNSAQIVLKYYLQRKKYFDAANILPIIVRNQNKDEKMKFVWVEVMQLSQADQKLIHLLVALAGPPGLVSQEFPVGGEPAAMSEDLYQAFKSLVDWFPSDPKVAYAMAWCAQKRGNEAEFYFYLRECLRREPDFCLGLLLFARVLADKQKLNEALFVYKYLRERLGSDRSVDMLTLTRLVENFVEKNGWISFTEGMMSAGEYSSRDFLNAFTESGSESKVEAQATNSNISSAAITTAAPNPKMPNIPVLEKHDSTSNEVSLPPKEIELSAMPESESSNSGMEIQLTSGEKLVKAEISHAAPNITPSNLEKVEEQIAHVSKYEEREPEQHLNSLPADEPLTSADATIVIKQQPTESLHVTETEKKPPAQTLLTTEVPELQTVAVTKKSPTIGFNPMAGMNVPGNAAEMQPPAEEPEVKTVLFTPMEAVQATALPRKHEDDPKTQVVEDAEDIATKTLAQPPELSASIPQQPALTAQPSEPQTNITNNLHHTAILQSAPTVLYDTAEAVRAGSDSLRSLDESGSEPVESPILPLQQNEVMGHNELVAGAQEEKSSVENPAGFGGAFVPIPQSPEGPAPLGAEVQPAIVSAGFADVDLGEDLLEGPTRILVNPDIHDVKDSTAHLLKEIQDDAKSAEATLDPSILLKKAERYIAKRNYYLARKAVRHALALGADEGFVKEKLREIRKLEMPDSLYAAVSSDTAKDEGGKNLLEKLEEEFDLKSDDSSEELKLLRDSIKSKFEEIFKDADARTIMDFAVGLHEMGLYKDAERFFIRMVNDHPEQSFDAYYLAAISKFARKDYAGAVSILKKLSMDNARSDKEKISIYYTLGEVFEKMQQNERSKSFYEKVASLDANYRNIRDKLEK